jgi:hypothetical protein
VLAVDGIVTGGFVTSPYYGLSATGRVVQLISPYRLSTYAEVEWLRHTNLCQTAVAEFCGFPGLGGG